MEAGQSQGQGAARKYHPLTTRQLQLVRLICRCPEPSALELAAVMCCAPKTVEAHRAKVYRKWRVHTRVELYTRALELGVVQCPRCGGAAEDPGA